MKDLTKNLINEDNYQQTTADLFTQSLTEDALDTDQFIHKTDVQVKSISNLLAVLGVDHPQRIVNNNNDDL